MYEEICRGFHEDSLGKEIIILNGKEYRGRWIEGYHIVLQDTTYLTKFEHDTHPENQKHYIVFDQMTDWGLPNNHIIIDVIPETVCQCTGKCIDGKKLFTGDIVEWYEDREDMWGHSVSIDERSVIIWDDENYCYSLKTGIIIQPFNDWCWDNSKLIGNIYSNPELLE